MNERTRGLTVPDSRHSNEPKNSFDYTNYLVRGPVITKVHMGSICTASCHISLRATSAFILSHISGNLTDINPIFSLFPLFLALVLFPANIWHQVVNIVFSRADSAEE